MASLLVGLEKSFHSFEEISQESMRNQSHYHSRKLQSLRKKRSLSGRPPRFQSCCTWPVSICRPKGREGSMPRLFWPLLCSAHCKLQQWLHLHDVIFKRLALPFSLNNHGVHGVGVRKTFLGDADSRHAVHRLHLLVIFRSDLKEGC